MALAEKEIVCDVNDGLRGLLVPISELTPDPRNARTHSERNIDSIADSLKQFGQQKPVVRKGNVVIAGNGTMAAAKKLGWTHIAVVEFSKGELDALGYKLADNRTAELAGWDSEILKADLEYLSLQAPDLETTNFWTPDEVEGLGAPTDLGGNDDEKPSDASLLKKLGVTMDEPKAKVEQGEVLALGNHKLIVADPVNDVAVWLPHMTPDVVFAPYAGPYIALTLIGQEKKIIIVQPDKFIAGHIIDRFNDIHNLTPAFPAPAKKKKK